VIALMRSQEGIQEMGGTMRLGAYPCRLRPGSLAAQTYNATAVSERHRHPGARPEVGRRSELAGRHE